MTIETVGHIASRASVLEHEERASRTARFVSTSKGNGAFEVQRACWALAELLYKALDICHHWVGLSVGPGWKLQRESSAKQCDE